MFPKFISSGDFFLPTYGVMVAIAFLAALWLTKRLAVRAGLNADLVMNLGIYCALAGMLGGKLAMFLFDWRIYAENPREIFSFATLQAMGVYQGGLILALAVAFFYMRAKALPPLATMDVFAPGIALGHGIGRIGCFAAGCCWGKQCDRPWAVTFRNPDANLLTGVPLNIPLHPTQLYEAGAEFAILWFLYRRFHRPHRTGAIIGWYLLLYSLVRFGVEFFRHHDQGLILGLSLTQWISAATFLLGVWLLKGRTAPAGSPVPYVK